VPASGDTYTDATESSLEVVRDARVLRYDLAGDGSSARKMARVVPADRELIE